MREATAPRRTESRRTDPRRYGVTPAAARMRAAISFGSLISDRCPESTSIVVAFMRLARKRSRSGLIVRSCFDTAYHDGLERHAVVVVFSLVSVATLDAASA